jgi:hypothetical protein
MPGRCSANGSLSLTTATGVRGRAVAAGLTKHRVHLHTGIGRPAIDRILAANASGGPSMGHLEAAMITDMNQGLRAVSAKPLVRVAEARGFEPRMGANPNRISSPFRAAKRPQTARA